MKRPVTSRMLVALGVFAMASMLSGNPVTLDLWPEGPPNETGVLSPEYDESGTTGKHVAGRRVIRLANVSVPNMTVYQPAVDKRTGTTVVIAPGGGFNILAYDLEGTEVAEWLNSIGVTAVVLKYRVPARYPAKRWFSAVQDTQRAMSLVRSRAKEWNIDPQRIGLMGFSAGGAATKITALAQKRFYTPVDEVDTVSFRPDFAIPIYAAYVLPEGVTITKDAPPFFMAIAHDDKDRALGLAEFYIGLKKAGISAEMHIYESGGHGYGLRKTSQPVSRWPDRLEEWMRQRNLIP